MSSIYQRQVELRKQGEYYYRVHCDVITTPNNNTIVIMEAPPRLYCADRMTMEGVGDFVTFPGQRNSM